MKNKKKTDPKIGNLTEAQALEIEKQRKWLNNWNNNRIIDGKKINNNVNIPFSNDIYIDDLNYNNPKFKTYGEYDTVSDRIIFDKDFSSKSGIPTHEFSHRFQKDLKKLNPFNYDQYIKSPILNSLKNIHNLSPYHADIEENHSEINRFRYNNNLKPDQVITPEDMDKFNFEDYNLKHFNKDQLLDLLNKTADNSKLQNINYAAYGGNLNNNNKNMLNEFNEGGTHEQNPLGGIPQGIGSNGKINTVEEGETKKGNFIYSDRIILTADIINTAGLPKSLIGKTVAEASKVINRKFEGRNSKIDNSTKETFLNRIAKAQEDIKVQEELKQAQISQSMDINSSEVPDMMNGEIPKGMESFINSNAEGGFFNLEQNPENANIISKGSDILSNIIAPGGTYGKQQTINQNSGFYDDKLAKDQMFEQGIGKLQDGVASAFGPVGLAVRGGQKLGKSIGDAIGGEGGQAVSSIFDPTSSALSNLTNKDLSLEQKALGMIPGFSGVISSKAAQKRLNEFEKEKRQQEYYKKYIEPTQNYNNVNINANGGFITDPVSNNNPNILKKNKVDILKNVNNLFGEENISEKQPTSRYLDILGIQKGVTHPKLGEGAYFYSGKTPLDKGFDPSKHREFIKNNAIREYLNSEQGRKYQERLQKQINAQKEAGLPITSYTNITPTSGFNFAYGGKINKYAYGDDLTRDPLKPLEGTMSDQEVTSNLVSSFNNRSDENLLPSNKPNVKFNPLNFDMLRYSPVAMNTFQLANMGSPEIEKLDRLNNQYQKQYLDEAVYENQARQQAMSGINAIGRSGISGGQLTNAILGSQLNRTKAVSDAYNKIKQHNIAEEKMRQQVKFGNNQTNLQQSNLEKDINARNRGAFNTERSKLLGQIGTDLGNIGNEETFKKLAKEVFGYTWDGKFVRDAQGNKVTKNDGTPLSRKEMLILKSEK